MKKNITHFLSSLALIPMILLTSTHNAIAQRQTTLGELPCQRVSGNVYSAYYRLVNKDISVGLEVFRAVAIIKDYLSAGGIHANRPYHVAC